MHRFNWTDEWTSSEYASSPSPTSTEGLPCYLDGCYETTSSDGAFLGEGGGAEGSEVGGVDEQSHLLVSSWVAIVLMCFVLVATIVGNLLVCISVVLVRKLRKPQNYLLVSLALSDLFVAVFVMPFAIVVELYQGVWPLNKSLCDLWVAADVLCCTASILNLCGISVDRYQAITAPFDYSARSTPKRMLGIIFVVWLGSACVSLPPVLLLGNEYQGPDGMAACSVSQNFWYQIYATMASFYIPLGVISVVYLKILRVVTVKKKEMNWKRKHSSLPIHFTNNNRRESEEASGDGGAGATGAAGAATTTTTTAASKGAIQGSTNSIFDSPANSSSSIPSLSPRTPPSSNASSSWSPPGGLGIPMTRLQQQSQKQHLNQHSMVVTTKLTTSVSAPQKTETIAVRLNNSHNVSSSNVSLLNNARNVKKTVEFGDLQSKRSVFTCLWIPCWHSKENNNQKLRTKKLLSGLKEHKASTTLGIIMSAFIICWLPFFVLALARPIFHVEIPDWISSLFNWLGYANSALNPIIYATLNRDFRRPFREILSFRCATLNSLMRKEFYLEQYGEETDNVVRAKASVTLIFLENGNIAEPLL